MNTPFMLQQIIDTIGLSNIAPFTQSANGNKDGMGHFAQVLGEVRRDYADSDHKASLRAEVPINGHDLIGKLKRYLKTGGVPLDQMVADDSALSAIEKVLVGAGFEETQVRNLLSELKRNAGGKGVRLSTLFHGISQLSDNSVQVKNSNYLEISTLPHFETILSKLGLSPEQTKTALNNAKVEGKGISAERLAFELKKFRQGKGPEEISPSIEELNEIELLMQQAGLSVNLRQADKLDMNSLIASLQRFSGRRDSLNERMEFGSSNESNNINDVTKHLKRMKGELSTTLEGRISFDDFAKELEKKVSSSPGSGDQRQGTGDWEQFVRNIKKAPQGNDLLPENAKYNKSELLSTMALSMPQSGISSSLFPDETLFQSVAEKRKEIENGFGKNKDNNKKPSVIDSNPISKLSYEIFGEKTPSDSDQYSHNSLEFNELMDSSFKSQGDNTKLEPLVKLEESKTKTSGGFKVESLSPEKAEASIFTAISKSGEQRIEGIASPMNVDKKGSDISSPVFGDRNSFAAHLVESKGVSNANQPQTRTFPYYLLDQVSRQILRSRLADENEIMIQLKPDNLGRMKMTIENTTEGIKVNIITETQSTRDILISNSNDLKAALLDQGVHLDKLNVEAQAGFGQTMADARHGSNDFSDRRRFSNSEIRPSERLEPLDGDDEVQQKIINNNNLLNLVV